MRGRPKGRKDTSPTAKENRSRSHIGNKGMHWKGGKVKKMDGYILIWSPSHPNNKGGYVAEHRLVMENHIGRVLTSTEVVHHINSIVSDNRIENLMLFANNNLHLNYHKYKVNKDLK